MKGQLAVRGSDCNEPGWPGKSISSTIGRPVPGGNAGLEAELGSPHAVRLD